MLAPGFVQRVLKTLVGAGVGTSMVAIEQLRAVRLLLSHVQDSRLKSVDPNGMSEIMAAFFSSWVRINTSWMGEPFGRDELKTHFQVSDLSRITRTSTTYSLSVCREPRGVLGHAPQLPSSGDSRHASFAHPSRHPSASLFPYLHAVFAVSSHQRGWSTFGQDCGASAGDRCASLKSVSGCDWTLWSVLSSVHVFPYLPRRQCYPGVVHMTHQTAFEASSHAGSSR